MPRSCRALADGRAVAGAALVCTLATLGIPVARDEVLATQAVATPTTWGVRFTDVARQAGLVVPNVYGGVDRKRFILEANGSGAALVDVDGDGWLDVFLVNGTRLADGTRNDAVWPPESAPVNRLYRSNRDGTFADVTSTSGLGRTNWGSGVCAGDYDNDGRVDLFVTAYGRNALYRNLGDARFEDVTARMGLGTSGRRWGAGCSFVDVDRDGRLDLFVANYLSLDLATASEPGGAANCLWKGVPVNCGPRGLPADTNLLYRNTGARFEDVSAASGVGRVSGRYSMTSVATDFDDDGWPDVYVASDSTAAILYRNNHDGTFTDVAVERGVAYSEQGTAQAGMGVALADVNGDGRLDILKTHFADDVPALYRALAGGLFEDVAVASGLGVQNRHVQWGTGLEDFDNDGFPDLFYVTGSVYPEVERVLAQYPYRGPRVVFRNAGGARFADMTGKSGGGAEGMHSSRGAAFGDVDNDGDVDVLVVNMNEAPSLLRNDEAPGGHWVGVRLQGSASNRAAIGAIVRVTAGGRTQARAVLSQSSYYSHNDLRAHVGLGAAARVDRIEVQWPSGVRETFPSVAADRVVTLVEGQTR